MTDSEFSYVDEHFQEFLDELKAAVRQPSIAAQNVGMSDMAGHFQNLMGSHGIEARIIPTGGYPCVYGEVKGESDKAVLFYDHYDVQPPEPLEEWVSDPFSGDIRDGKIYARGVSDNKGHACSRIQAVGALLRMRGKLPLTVKFLIEGEEEIGSPHLAEFIRDHTGLLKADYGVWESGYMGEGGIPGMYLGVKGMLYIELEARGARTDMHSGAASSVPNPAWRLVWALSTLKDENERVLIPGFYDDVLEPTPAELEMMRDSESEDSPPDGDGEKDSGPVDRRAGIGIKSPLLQYTGFDLRVRSLFSPTANICGFKSGYTGEGQKTVLPSRALVKMDFRLVPDQDPKDILGKLQRHLVDKGFDDVEMRLLSMDYPVKTSAGHPVVAAARDAAVRVYGKKPAISPTQGGSGPMHPFKKHLGLPMLGFGVGYWGSSNHAPNENIRLKDYRDGIKMVMAFIDNLAVS